MAQPPRQGGCTGATSQAGPALPDPGSGLRLGHKNLKRGPGFSLHHPHLILAKRKINAYVQLQFTQQSNQLITPFTELLGSLSGCCQGGRGGGLVPGVERGALTPHTGQSERAAASALIVGPPPPPRRTIPLPPSSGTRPRPARLILGVFLHTQQRGNSKGKPALAPSLLTLRRLPLP